MPRKICHQCQRPHTVCLCAHRIDLQAPCQILILQHPSEQKQPLATVPILRLCLSPLEVLVGEDFSGHGVVKTLLKKKSRCRILFPADNCQTWTVGQYAKPEEVIDTLIVLDGTWRKAKKIWHINQWLQQIPFVNLANTPNSLYQIRSTSIAGGVSTLEAVTHACNYLDGSKRFEQLYEPFKAMIDMQINKMGRDVFLAHYQE